MDTSRKGSRMEALCLKELIELFSENTHTEKIVAWHTHRDRSGGNDFLDAWDLALLNRDVRTWLNYLTLVQVKDLYSNKDMKYLGERKPYAIQAYFAVYAREPRHYAFKTEHFWFIEVE